MRYTPPLRQTGASEWSSDHSHVTEHLAPFTLLTSDANKPLEVLPIHITAKARLSSARCQLCIGYGTQSTCYELPPCHRALFVANTDEGRVKYVALKFTGGI